MSGKLLKCPVCGHPVKMESGKRRPKPPFPFCSERCRLIDLGRWLGEHYRVPAVEQDEWEPFDDGSDRGHDRDQSGSAPDRS